MTIQHTSMAVPVDRVTIPADRVEHDRHSAEKDTTMTASMRERGLLQPILIDRTWTLIDGEKRLNIARALGWNTIDARVAQVVAADLSELQLLDLARDANVERAEISALGVAEYARRRHALLAAQSPGLTEVTRVAAAEAGISARKVHRAARILRETRNPDPMVRATAEDALRRVEAGEIPTRVADERISTAVREARDVAQLPGFAHGQNGTVTVLPKKHAEVVAAESILGDVVLRGNQLVDGLAGLAEAGERLAEYEAVHRQAALATRNDRARGVIREVLAVSLDGLDQLRAVLAEDLAALGEGVAA